MSEPTFHRIHPLTILVEGWRAVSRMLWLFALAAFSMITKRGMSDTTEMWVSGLGLIVGFSALFRYVTYRYAVHQGKLIVKEGLFTRKDRTIPLDRIQNINLRRDLIHRVLGLVDLEIETAAGAKAEATISAVTEDQAHSIKQMLLGSVDVSASPIIEKRREEVLYEATPKELLIAGMSENRIFVILASVAGLFGVTSQTLGNLVEQAASFLKKGGWLEQNGWVLFAILSLIAILIGWLASIVMTFVNYWGFEVAFRDGRFRRSYGLLNNYENVVPVRRIQVVRVSDNFIQRALGFGKLYMDTAGAFAEKEGDQKHAAARPTPLMAPLIRFEGMHVLIERVLPGISLDASHWQGTPASTVMHGIVTSLPVILFLAAGSAFYIQWWSIAVLAALLLLFWIIVRARWRRMRWHDDGDRLFISQGWLWRSVVVAPIEKIQKVEFSQGPFQKRLGLASVVCSTAAAGSKGRVSLENISAEGARELARDIHRRSARNAWKNPDGF